MLSTTDFKAYIEQFNAEDAELYPQAIPNECAWEFLAANIPLFTCPDKELELTYYFRWWVYRKHLKQTPLGWVVTQFLPAVPWAGRHNTINGTAGRNVVEGRWLRDSQFIEDYARFWFHADGGTMSGPRAYTCWLGFALCERARVTGDWSLCLELFDQLAANYRAWEKGWLLENGFHVGLNEKDGLFHTTDDRDGGEASIGGHGARPYLNSAMLAEARAIGEVAARAGRDAVAAEFHAKAERLAGNLVRHLWNPELEFFCVRHPDGGLADVRELYGYAPWLADMSLPEHESVWAQLRDPHGFQAAYGPTFAEQRHPGFRLSYEGHECQWDGPSWPMATALTATALANLLNQDRRQPKTVGKRDFFELMTTYARSHRRVHEDGRIVPWIDENLHPYTGDWISRTRLKAWGNGKWSAAKGGVERGKDYNHSTFCDLVITGLCGLRPQNDDSIIVNPLIPDNAWDWFCLDRVKVRGRDLTILWDRDGSRFGRGAGLQVFINGALATRSDRLERIEVEWPRGD